MTTEIWMLAGPPARAERHRVSAMKSFLLACAVLIGLIAALTVFGLAVWTATLAAEWIGECVGAFLGWVFE